MTENALLENIKSLQQKHQNIKITIGSILGFVLIFYFFTFAMLVDKFPRGFFIFEAISTVLIVICLFKLNNVAMAVFKVMAGRHKDLLGKLTASDMDTNAEDLEKKLG